jgi:hypothetical protein
MKKITKRSKLIKVLKKLRIDAIVPFKEKPSAELSDPNRISDPNKKDASELFSLFTADIIKEDIEFVR